MFQKIIQFADEIAFTIRERGLDFPKLSGAVIEKNALAMRVLQIGELVGHLSEDFKRANDVVPWQSIRAMRNIAARNYGAFDTQILWEVASDDVPKLKPIAKRRRPNDRQLPRRRRMLADAAKKGVVALIA
jgi:uncharacterized protein with HEPN domain